MLAKILLVDDERNILSALKRLLRQEDYQIFTANSGAEALELLKETTFDLVISDMRMPQMTGAELLGKIAENHPQSVRILLTGYADIESTIAAINDGKIYAYISKPWEDNQLKLTIKNALANKILKDKEQQLTTELKEANTKLNQYNQDLESMVAARTQELKQTMDFLESAYDELKASSFAALPMLANLVEIKLGQQPGTNIKLAKLARGFAEALQLSEGQVSLVEKTLYLHNIGKLALPDRIVRKTLSQLNAEELEIYQQHVLIAESALFNNEQLVDVANVIKHMEERPDGKGYPQQLTEEAIPIATQVVTLISHFQALQDGLLISDSLSYEQAKDFLRYNAGQRYANALVDRFLNYLDTQSIENSHNDIMHVAVDELIPGMLLADDLISAAGVFLLGKGQSISEVSIARLQALSTSLENITIQKSNDGSK